MLNSVISDICTNCGKPTGISIKSKNPSDPKYGEIVFEVPSILGKSYKFFSDKFVIYKGSRVLEQIPYSSLKDCDVRVISGSISGRPAPSGPNFGVTITLTMNGNPKRQIEFTGNPMNVKLDSDLAFWLNAKIAENESKSGTEN